MTVLELVAACSYILEKFHVEQEWLKHVEVVEISKKSITELNSVLYFSVINLV